MTSNFHKKKIEKLANVFLECVEDLTPNQKYRGYLIDKFLLIQYLGTTENNWEAFIIIIKGGTVHSVHIALLWDVLTSLIRRSEFACFRVVQRC